MISIKKSKKAFTLIEMAVVLVIIGLLVGLIAPLVTDFIRHDKKVQARDFVKEVKDRIIGYALINKRLPPEATWKSEIGVGKDPYGEELVYMVDSALTSGDMCTKSPSDNIEIIKDISASDSETYRDIAFIVYSTGRNVGAEINTSGRPTIRIADPRYYSSWPSSPGNTDEWDDIVEYATFPYLRNKVCTNTENTSFTPQGSNVSFGRNIGDFDKTAVANPPGQNVGNISINADGTVSLGKGVGGAGETLRGCVWYQGDNTDGNCVDGKCEFNYGFRAFFTFKHNKADTSVGSSDIVSGFTFAFLDGDKNTSEVCGGYASANRLGFAGQSGTTPAIEPPKWAIEFDSYLDTAAGARNDPTRNHAAIVWFADTDSTGPDWTYSEDDNRHFAYFNPIDPDLSDYHLGDRNANPPSNAATLETEDNDLGAVAVGSTVTWLEDQVEHTVRVEVYRNATGATSGGPADGLAIVNATVWIDCTVDCSDLTQPYNGGADETVYQNVTLLNNASSPNGFQTFRFGWTQSTATVSPGTRAQDLTISDFGIKFLNDDPSHVF